MSKVVLLAALTALLLVPIFTLLLLPRLSPGDAQAVGAAAEGGQVELELVGRWPYGPALAVAAGDIDGTPYAFLGSGSIVLVLDITDPSTPNKIARW